MENNQNEALLRELLEEKKKSAALKRRLTRAIEIIAGVLCFNALMSIINSIIAFVAAGRIGF